MKTLFISKLSALSATVFLTFLAHAQADTQQIKIKPIDGFCFYDSSYEADASILRKLKKVSPDQPDIQQMGLSMLVPCSYLEDYRSWYSKWWIKFFSKYPKPEQTLMLHALEKLSKEDRQHVSQDFFNKELCEDARKAEIVFDFEKLKDPDFAREFRNELPLGEKKVAGYLTLDKELCYTGKVTKKLDGGKWDIKLNLNAVKLKNDTPIGLFVQTKYTDYNSLLTVVDTLKKFTAAQ